MLGLPPGSFLTHVNLFELNKTDKSAGVGLQTNGLRLSLWSVPEGKKSRPNSQNSQAELKSATESCKPKGWWHVFTHLLF